MKLRCGSDMCQWPAISAPSPDLASESVPAQPALPRSKVAGPAAAWAGVSDHLSCRPSPRQPARPVLPRRPGRCAQRAISTAPPVSFAAPRAGVGVHVIMPPQHCAGPMGPGPGARPSRECPPAARGPPAGGPSGPETPPPASSAACQCTGTRRTRARIRRISLPQRLLRGIPHSAASVCAG